MKVRPFRFPRWLTSAGAQGRSVLRGFCSAAIGQKSFAFAIFALVLVGGFFLGPHDQELLARLHFWNIAHERVARRVAYLLGTWGDFPTYNVPLALLIWGYGAWRKSATWRRVALVCFLGAALAGLADDCLRLTLGRPRPDAHVTDGFYGPLYAMRGGYQSFPSGHAASVLGAATALLVVEWPLGLVAAFYGLAVVWGRMELYRHYPSDVMVGCLIGIYFGTLVGVGSRWQGGARRTGLRPTSLDSPSARS